MMPVRLREWAGFGVRRQSGAATPLWTILSRPAGLNRQLVINEFIRVFKPVWRDTWFCPPNPPPAHASKSLFIDSRRAADSYKIFRPDPSSCLNPGLLRAVLAVKFRS